MPMSPSTPPGLRTFCLGRYVLWQVNHGLAVLSQDDPMAANIGVADLTNVILTVFAHSVLGGMCFGRWTMGWLSCPKMTPWRLI